MKKTALAAFILAMAPVAAQADLLFTVGAKASIWNADPSGNIDNGVSLGKSGLNLGSENGQQLTLFIEHPLPVVPNLKLKSTSLELDGNGSLNVNFLGETFNEDVKSTLDLSHKDLTLYWGLPLPLPYIDINFGLTARQFDGVAEARGKTSNTVASEKLDFTLPMVYAELKVNTPFGVYAAADINYLGIGDNKMSDITYTLGYDLPVPVVDLGLEAGFRTLSLQTDEDKVDVETDIKVSGLYFGASLSLGF